jgi:hypothetical protein
LGNKDAVSAALKKADFTSLRGDFKFNVNGYPIQNFYLTKVAKRADGKFQTEIVEKVLKIMATVTPRTARRANKRRHINAGRKYNDEDRNRGDHPGQ